MKTCSLLWISFPLAIICRAEPTPTPVPTPRVIILEAKREQLEHDRTTTEKRYSAKELDRASYERGMKEYKSGIENYRHESRKAAGASDSKGRR
jgi:hypothetical protein